MAKNLPPKQISLAKLIFRQYARSALFVIMTIELLLLLLYFGAIAVGTTIAERTLFSALGREVHASVADSTHELAQKFKKIEDDAEGLARQHVPLFSDPQSIEVPAPRPVITEAPNGSYYQESPTNGSSFFTPKSSVPRMTDRQWEFATNSIAMDAFYKQIVEESQNPKVVQAYVNVDEPADMNRLYPFIPKVWEQYPDTLDMSDYNFWYLADERHNPQRKAQWTGVYLDPAGRGWMISCVAPVYNEHRLEAVVGLDVAISDLVSDMARVELPYEGEACLVDEGGSVIAFLYNKTLKKIFPGLRHLDRDSRGYESVAEEKLDPEQINISSIKDPLVRKKVRSLLGMGEGLSLGTIWSQIRGFLKKDAVSTGNNMPAFFSPVISGAENAAEPEFVLMAEEIPDTPWKILVVFEGKDLPEPTKQDFANLYRKVRLATTIGWLVLAGVTVFYAGFFFYLWRRAARVAESVAAPLNALSSVSSDLGAGRPVDELPESGIKEIDTLSQNFGRMSSKLSENAQRLIESRELYQTLSDTAADSLHDIGNKVHMMNDHLNVLNQVIEGLDKYPEAFRRIREGGESGARALKNLEAALGKSVGALKEMAPVLNNLSEEVDTAINGQRFVYKSAKSSAGQRAELPGVTSALQHIPEDIHLSSLLEEVCRSFRGESALLEASIQPDVRVRSHNIPLRAGLDNVIRNAFGASPHGGRIVVSCQPTAEGAVVTVRDEGQGIAKEDLAMVGKRRGYTTKKRGQGLGLFKFGEFLKQTGGRLDIFSEGLGQGATVTAFIRNV